MENNTVAKNLHGLGEWVVRKSARGFTYRVWRRARRMPKIPQFYLDCSIYLYDSRRSAENGENFGGSGCLVRLESNPIFDPTSFRNGRYHRVSIYFPPHIYAVTNKHVVNAGFHVVRLNTVDNVSDVLELEYEDWIPHPDGDDLVVAPIDLPSTRFDYFPIDVNSFINRYTFHSHVGAGDDTFMVGRFINHAGKQRNTPSLRFGSVAMLPFEKIKLQNGHMQEAFLVETRSISGYSGSPVFVYRPAEQTTRIPATPATLESNSTPETYRTTITDLVGYPALLGIDCGHVHKYEKVRDYTGTPHPAGWEVESNTGMAIVIPAWRLTDLLNTEVLVMQRKQKDQQYQEEHEAKEQRGSVTFDAEKPEGITKESYQDALKRASRKISSPDEEKNKS
jgi:hypothetical protein